ncbi:MAG: response regulator [Thermomicrobiales bacterium]
MMNTTPRCPHVLLVDDTVAIRDLMRELLEDEGYQVTIAASVQDVETVRELAPDLIVHDLLFGDHRPAGWTFLQALRNDPQVGRVPVILCTADCRVQTDPEWADQVQSLALRVVTKPFDLTDFLTVISSTLHENRGGAMTGSAP